MDRIESTIAFLEISKHSRSFVENPLVEACKNGIEIGDEVGISLRRNQEG